MALSGAVTDFLGPYPEKGKKKNIWRKNGIETLFHDQEHTLYVVCSKSNASNLFPLQQMEHFFYYNKEHNNTA